jgi:hypothetical protein
MSGAMMSLRRWDMRARRTSSRNRCTRTRMFCVGTVASRLTCDLPRDSSTRTHIRSADRAEAAAEVPHARERRGGARRPCLDGHCRILPMSITSLIALPWSPRAIPPVHELHLSLLAHQSAHDVGAASPERSVRRVTKATLRRLVARGAAMLIRHSQ